MIERILGSPHRGSQHTVEFQVPADPAQTSAARLPIAVASRLSSLADLPVRPYNSEKRLAKGCCKTPILQIRSVDREFPGKR